MKLVAVTADQVPERRRAYNKLQKMLRDFANSNHEIVLLDFAEGEYKSPITACQVISVAIKRSKRPLKVFRRGDNVYLTKIR